MLMKMTEMSEIRFATDWEESNKVADHAKGAALGFELPEVEMDSSRLALPQIAAP